MANLLVSLKDKLAIDLRNSDIGTAFRQVENWANAYKKITPTFQANYSTFSGSVAYIVVDPFGWINFQGAVSYSGPNIPAGTYSTFWSLPPTIQFNSTRQGDLYMPCTLGLSLGATAASVIKITAVFGLVAFQVYLPSAQTAFSIFFTGARYHP